MMPRATRLTASVIGVYAGLLGAMHGVFEIRQGNITPDGLSIQAIGGTCDAEAMSHACWPALTLIPNIGLSGVFAIIAGVMIIGWAVGFLHRPHASRMMFALAFLLLIVGGGFLPPFYAVIAGMTAAQISRRRDLPAKLARLWPTLLIVYFVWVGLQLVFTNTLNDFLLNTGGLLLPLEIGFLLLSILSALAFDHQALSQQNRRLS